MRSQATLLGSGSSPSTAQVSEVRLRALTSCVCCPKLEGAGQAFLFPSGTNPARVLCAPSFHWLTNILILNLGPRTSWGAT